MKTRFKLPEVVLEIEGGPMAADESRALEEVRISQRLSQPAQCELTFRDPPGPLNMPLRLAPGYRLRVGLRGVSQPLFVGEVTGIEHTYGPAHEREIRVRGYDLLHRLRKRQQVRAHVQETLPDLARELVGDLGLSIHSEASLPIAWKRIIQHRQSDLELLVEIAARCGVYLALRENTLHLLTLEGSGAPVPLRLGDSLYEARVDINGDPACRSVKVDGWDPLAVETHSGKANEARSGRQVAVQAPPDQFGEEGTRSLEDELAADDRQAEALAQAELDLRLAREVTFWGVAEGDPALMPGATIAVEGLDNMQEGRYVLTSVTHQINARLGFVSELSSEPPAPIARPRSSIVALGIVTSVADPDHAGRVQVKLPTYNQVETEWMGVLCNAAGQGKGLVMLPDVGDSVLVLFPRQDPAEGIVLGGLYGIKGPPDSGVEGDGVRRYTFLTEGGQKIVLDDTRRSVHLEDKTGSSVDFSPEKFKLHAAVDLEIEAPGKSVVIRGQSIDFERG